MQKAFIPLPGGGTAVYTSTGLTYYRHTDHLGSSRLATTPTRTLYSSTAYAPFGEPYAQAGTTDLSFTGQDQDTVSGMTDFWARKYTTTSGRWLSPDPAGIGAVDPSNPQTWNRYAYVGNSPLNMIDPLGEDPYAGCVVGVTPWCYDQFVIPGGITFGAYSVTNVEVTEGGQLYTITPDGVIIVGGWDCDGCTINETVTTYTSYTYIVSYSIYNTPPGGGAANNVEPIVPAKPYNRDDCLKQAYNSPVGKAVQFGSPLTLLPGWNPGWRENMKDWGEAILLKGGSLEVTKFISVEAKAAMAGIEGAIKKVAPYGGALATMGDLTIHMNCANADPNRDAIADMPD